MDDVWLPKKKYKNTVIARLYLSVKATIVQHTDKMFKKYLVISVTIFRDILEMFRNEKK